MAKDYKAGHALGQKDGESGDNQLASHSFKRVFTHVGSWLPGADSRDAQFRAGYQDGFKDKIRTIQTAPANPSAHQSHTTNTGNTMSNTTSFGYQVELLQALKHYLNDFQERLLGVSANYERKLDELHGAGLMDETHQRYVERELAETQAMIARLVEHIGASDIPAVERETTYLEQKL